MIAAPAPLRRALLAWYDRNKRDLPWRRDRDPYRVLVSELMLQQTQVKTVLPYYEKFLAEFPTAKKLASAPEARLLSAWAGLGYYRRARFLQSCAAKVAEGGFPSTLEGLRSLPGVGAYTAAALGSICFGLAHPVVDGNVIRVLARVLALRQDAKSREGLQSIALAAGELLDAGRPGDFNQAIMELGALICTPRQPACPLCPLAKGCKARALGRPDEFPKLPSRAPASRVRKALALVTRGGAVLCAPRLGPGRMVGMWQFPEAEIGESEDAAARAAGLARNALASAPKALGACPVVTHTVTRFRIRVEAFRFSAQGRPKAPWQWVELAELERLPLASAEKRLSGMLRSLA
jgi:A/G-specific adenine glycosylase